MATIDDNLAKTVTEAFRQAQIDIANQDKLLTGPGDVTLTRADGTLVTGPSWPKMTGITTSSIQWRGGIPASKNLNEMGPNSTYVGAWGQSSVSATAADIANGYPAPERGVLEIFAGGRSNGTQRYTTDAGRLFTRWLTGSWNGSGPWSDWWEVGGLSSNTVLPTTVTTLSDATYFAQNQTYVLAGIRTDSPVGLTAGQNNAIIMSVRRGGGTIMGLHQTLFTAVGTYERYGAPNAATGWTSVSWYSGGDAYGWRLVGADAMAAIGVGVASQGSATAFDWQQADFYSGQIQVTNVTGWLNAPPELKSPAGDIVAIDCVMARTSATMWVVRLTSQSMTPSARYEYMVVIKGAKGSRTFNVVQEFNSDPTTVIPIANGGTGATTQAAALTAILGGNALSVANGGTGAKDSTSACTNLKAMSVDTAVIANADLPTLPSRVFQADTSTVVSNGRPYNYWLGLNIADGAQDYAQLAFPLLEEKVPKIRYRINTPSPRFTTFREFFVRDVNTAVDTNGFIKIASPIVKVFGNGESETNDESEGAAVERIGVGEYLITGVLGLNSDASWSGIDGGFDIPKDRNLQPLVWLDYEVNADGSVLVKTYHRTHPGAPVFARNEREGVAEGDPIDIPADQFVSVRVGMPADSIYNKKLEEAARIQAEREEARRLEEEEAEAAANPGEQPEVQQ